MPTHQSVLITSSCIKPTHGMTVAALLAAVVAAAVRVDHYENFYWKFQVTAAKNKLVFATTNKFPPFNRKRKIMIKNGKIQTSKMLSTA